MGLAGAASAVLPVPALQRRVTDLTATLSEGQCQELEALLQQFEARKGAQIAVLLVPTTAPEAIEQFGIRVVEQWKLGRKGIDDGVLVLVAKEDRAVRIEVGYGLEGVLPDAIGKRIVEEVIVPAFKQGDFRGGIEAGLRRVMGVIEGEALPPPARTAARAKGIGDWVPFLIFGIPIGGQLLRMALGRLPAAGLGSGATALILWLISAPVVVIVVAAFFVFIFIFGNSSGAGYGGRSTGGGGFGGGGWSGGGSGGGFSGGGGSFGGGGASGRW